MLAQVGECEFLCSKPVDLCVVLTITNDKTHFLKFLKCSYLHVEGFLCGGKGNIYKRKQIVHSGSHLYFDFQSAAGSDMLATPAFS